MSRYQEVLDNFFSSLLPTIDDNVRVYAITEGLKLPDDSRIIRVDRAEFAPNKYFNKVLKDIDGDYFGIVNDDIVFSQGWLEDVLEKLKTYPCVSPGFVESKDVSKLEKAISKDGVVTGLFDAFYIFNREVLDTLGKFDEEVVGWYDIDFMLSLYGAGFIPVTSLKVTVLHLGRVSYSLEERDRKSTRDAILKKYGRDGLLIAKTNPLYIREVFICP